MKRAKGWKFSQLIKQKQKKESVQKLGFWTLSFSVDGNGEQGQPIDKKHAEVMSKSILFSSGCPIGV
ncbi:hypothetical protein F9802_14725 [Bacillus aerolatus]|uniref:Uncharacterized protein n=1 Tax=Bacillus aerolatus TaxID=2653354 RepID=A0A6I1FD10_9BACI|nr:hypothetical protein F9802_14725 [Bacillus aerolatus]